MKASEPRAREPGARSRVAMRLGGLFDADGRSANLNRRSCIEEVVCREVKMNGLSTSGRPRG